MRWRQLMDNTQTRQWQIFKLMRQILLPGDDEKQNGAKGSVNIRLILWHHSFVGGQGYTMFVCYQIYDSAMCKWTEKNSIWGSYTHCYKQDSLVDLSTLNQTHSRGEKASSYYVKTLRNVQVETNGEKTICLCVNSHCRSTAVFWKSTATSVLVFPVAH